MEKNNRKYEGGKRYKWVIEKEIREEGEKQRGQPWIKKKYSWEKETFYIREREKNEKEYLNNEEKNGVF